MEIEHFIIALLFVLSFCVGNVFNQYVFNPSVPVASAQPTYKFMTIAKEVALANKYELGVYDCRNYSQELVTQLNAAGYDAKEVTGWRSIGTYCKANLSDNGLLSPATISNTSCAGPHMWVEVTIPIEAITGELIDVNNKG